MLAGALDDALTGGRAWADALGDYQRRRDQATRDGFRVTLSAAAFAPLPANLRRCYEAAASRPEEVTRILGALGGVIPPGEVYSGPAIQALVAVSGRTPADR